MGVLLVINATLDDARERAIAEGHYPRKDYLELQHALGADVVDCGALGKRLWTRVVRRLAGVRCAQVLLAWVLSARYDTVFADNEATGFALAALLKLRRRRPRLVMIGHLLSSPRKQTLCRALSLPSVIDAVLVHSSLQERLAHRSLGFRPDQVTLVPYQTDDRFWAPRDVPIKNQVCSVGLEYRDYRSLIEAVKDLPLDLVIVAGSHWSKHHALDSTQALPPNVRIASTDAASLDYETLRQLYAESLFVIVPLRDVESPAGVTTILEAMAMGKTVIVSHSRGQTDVVRDRRSLNRADPLRRTQPDWSRLAGSTGGTALMSTGFYVMPGDSAELRRAIMFLLQHPEEAAAMGINGRRLVENVLSLDHFTARMTALIRGDRPVSDSNRTADVPVHTTTAS